MRIACLHTADSNIAVFESAARRIGVALSHTVREELLREAEAAGGLTPGIAVRTAEVLKGLAADADGVLLTCSTLGPSVLAVEQAASSVPVLRVDAALARQAVGAAGGGGIVVLFAVETTREPTRALFEAAPGADPGRIAYRLVAGAWTAFRGGDADGYQRMIADAADAAFADGASVVALAQASMAGAARLTRKGRPLTSPAAGLAAMQALIAGRP